MDIYEHKAAVMSVVKYHVYNVQKFSKNKEKLWNFLKLNFDFNDSVYFFLYQRKYLKGILYFLKIFFTSPIRISLIALRKFRKFLF